MLIQIFKNELKIISREKTLWIVIAALFFAVGYAAYSGINRVNNQKDSIKKYTEFEEKRQSSFQQKVKDIERQIAQGVPESSFPKVSSTFRERNPVVVGGHFVTSSRSAVLPPSSLAALMVGQTDLYPPAYSMSTSSQTQLLKIRTAANPLKMAIGYFDLTFVAVYLFPLLILGLSYNLISGEKENGILSILLSQPISIFQLVLAKCGARAVLVLIIPLVGFALGGLIVADSLDRTTILKLFICGIAFVIYGIFWFSLAVLVNSLNRNSSANAVILAMFWLLFLIIIPTLSNLVANSLFPIPSRLEFVNKIRKTEEKLKEENKELLEKFLSEHPVFAADENLTPLKKYYATEAA